MDGVAEAEAAVVAALVVVAALFVVVRVVALVEVGLVVRYAQARSQLERVLLQLARAPVPRVRCEYER
jgi:hypothetical protein